MEQRQTFVVRAGEFKIGFDDRIVSQTFINAAQKRFEALARTRRDGDISGVACN